VKGWYGGRGGGGGPRGGGAVWIFGNRGVRGSETTGEIGLEGRNGLVVGIRPGVEEIMAGIYVMGELCMVVAQVAERTCAGATVEMGRIKGEGAGGGVVGKGGGGEVVVVTTLVVVVDVGGIDSVVDAAGGEGGRGRRGLDKGKGVGDGEHTRWERV